MYQLPNTPNFAENKEFKWLKVVKMELCAFLSCNLLSFIAHFFIMGINICIYDSGTVNNK